MKPRTRLLTGSVVLRIHFSALAHPGRAFHPDLLSAVTIAIEQHELSFRIALIDCGTYIAAGRRNHHVRLGAE